MPGYPVSLYNSALPNLDWVFLREAQSYFNSGKCDMNFWGSGSLQMIVRTADLSSCSLPTVTPANCRTRRAAIFHLRVQHRNGLSSSIQIR